MKPIPKPKVALSYSIFRKLDVSNHYIQEIVLEPQEDMRTRVQLRFTTMESSLPLQFDLCGRPIDDRFWLDSERTL